MQPIELDGLDVEPHGDFSTGKLVFHFIESAIYPEPEKVIWDVRFSHPDDFIVRDQHGSIVMSKHIRTALYERILKAWNVIFYQWGVLKDNNLPFAYAYMLHVMRENIKSDIKDHLSIHSEDPDPISLLKIAFNLEIDRIVISKP